MSPRKVALLIFLVSTAVFGLAVWKMMWRIVEFNRKANFVRFHAEPIIARDFRLEGWPRGTLTDHTETIDGVERNFLELDFGGKKTLIPAKDPPAKDVPNLSVYDEWVKVLGFNEVERDPNDPEGKSRDVPGSARLWIVTRNTPPGYDEETWGSVRRAEWLFTFYELGKDGSVTIEHRRWPRGYRGEKYLQERAAAFAARPANQGTAPSQALDEDARLAALAKIPALKERSTEYYAALFVIPKINMPQYKFEDTALQFHVLGWTVPAAGFAVLGMLYGLAFAIAPKRVTAA